MAKLSMTEKQAQMLVKRGHMTPSTFSMIKAKGGFAQGFDDGGQVQAQASGDGPNATPPQDAPQEYQPTRLDERAAYLQAQNPGMTLGDAMAKVAMQDNPQQSDQGLRPGESFADQRARLDAQPSYDDRLAAARVQMAPAQPIPGGVQVASNDPNVDRQIASNIVKPQGAATEAGHMPNDNLVPTPQQQAQGQPQPPILGQDYMKNMTAGMDQQLKGVQDQAKAEAAQGNSLFNMYRETANQLKDQQLAESDRENDRQDAVSKGLLNLQKLQDQILDPKNAISANHYWAEKGTAGKITAAIALALGGLGGGLTGHGGNAAMEVINKAIDRDMEAQKANMTNRQNQFNSGLAIFSAQRQGFSDERQAALAARSMLLQQAQLQAEQFKAKFAGPEAEARFNQVAGGLKQQQEQTKAALAKSIWEAQGLRQLTTGGGGGYVNPYSLPEHERPLLINTPNGQKLAPTPEAAADLRKAYAAHIGFQKGIDEMRQLQQQVGRGMPWSTASEQAKAIRSRMVTEMNSLAQIQRLNKEEVELFENQIPDATAFRQGKTTALLNDLQKYAGDKLDAYYQATLPGYQPIHAKVQR